MNKVILLKFIKYKIYKKFYTLIIDMSDYTLKYSEPIPIQYSEDDLDYSDPSFTNTTYIFDLSINVKNKKYKFKKIESNKYSNMIESENNISYYDIFSFELVITELNSQTRYVMYGNLEHNNNFFSQKDNDIYIEFYQDPLGKTVCTCYFIGINNNTIFISPPN